MSFCRYAQMSFLLVAISGAVCRADDMATQIGKVICTPSGAHWNCPNVTFPHQFGGTPDVIVSLSGADQAYASAIGLSANNITPSGFSPGISNGNGDNSVWISWVAVGPAVLHATAVPKYLVLTVIYAPPGTNGGHSTTSVNYQADSTLGTTTSASQSFTTGTSISIEASGPKDIVGAGVNFNLSQTTTDSQSLEIRKSTSSAINLNGPAQDGINHDQDEIWLLLNPTIDLALSPSSVAWTFANSPSPLVVQRIYAGWLNGHVPPIFQLHGRHFGGGIYRYDVPHFRVCNRSRY